MDRIFSTRIEEAALDKLDRITRRLGITKKQFVEDAIREHAQRLGEANPKTDVWAATLGAWARKESPDTTVRQAREAFRRSFDRHRRSAHARLHR